MQDDIIAQTEQGLRSEGLGGGIVVIRTKATVDEEMLKKIDELQLSERLSGWKAALLDTKPRISTERAKLAMESWKESEGEDIEIRRAPHM